MGENRMISRFPSAGELNLDSFAADLDTGGSPGALSVSGAAGAVACLRRGLLSGGLPVAA